MLTPFWQYVMKTHRSRCYKHHVLYFHVNTNDHYSSCHSVPNTLSVTHLSHKSRQTNKHHSTAERNISITFQTNLAIAMLQQNLLILGMSRAKRSNFRRGELKDTSWHGVVVGFCCLSGEKVACAAPISLCYVNVMTSYRVSERQRWSYTVLVCFIKAFKALNWNQRTLCPLYELCSIMRTRGMSFFVNAVYNIKALANISVWSAY